MSGEALEQMLFMLEGALIFIGGIVYGVWQSKRRGR